MRILSKSTNVSYCSMCYVLPYNQILVPWPVSRMLERDFLRSCGTKNEEVDYAARDVLSERVTPF